MKGTYRTADLLALVSENRSKHLEVLGDALEGYREQATEILEATMQSIKDGRTPELRIMLARPENHSRDYDRILKMLELEVHDEIELDERQFANYVMDDWDWKRTWVRRMSSYASASTRQAYGDDFEDEE